MDRVVTGIVDWKAKELIMEGQGIKVDELGGFYVNIEDLFIPEDPMTHAENEINEILTNEEQTILYNCLINSSSTTLSGLAEAMKKDKDTLKQALSVGMRHGILARGWNNTWKAASAMMKDRMKNRVRQLSEQRVQTKAQPKGVLDILHAGLDKYKRENNIQEETIHNPETDMPVGQQLKESTQQTSKKKPSTQSSVRKQ